MTEEAPAGRGLDELEGAKSGSVYDIDDLRVENQRLRLGLAQMQADVLRLSRTLEPMHRLNEELAALRDEAKQLRAERQSHYERAKEFAEQMERLRAAERANGQAWREHSERLAATERTNREQIELLAGQLRAVYDSSSWRLTQPVRRLKQCFFRIIPISTSRN
jgi:septal ring factor EnvC (AmiA/AmiB activator)